MNSGRALAEFGQSIWLDNIRRGMLENGELKRLIEDDGISGITSNPAIFEKAIAASDDYAAAIAALATDPGLDAEAIYERLAEDDIRVAADLLRPVWEATDGRDGYVSLEVSPHLARDTAGTVAAAHRLWDVVDRPNLMIKVPATPEGLPAFETLIADGLNVNVTLLFSVAVYEDIVAAYLRGLERAQGAGRDLARIASVASFFMSRIDTAVDARAEELMSAGVAGAEAAQGTVAVASGKVAYMRWQALFTGPRWAALAAAGARPQRLLWASTSTKNPTYDDLLYVTPLIGPETVNTLPPKTLDALRDHGRAAVTVETGREEAVALLAALPGLGIDLAAITEVLLEEGLAQFDRAYDKLLAAVRTAVEAHRRG